MRIEALPADDILRRLPSIIDSQQRLQIDVQVHCHDVMIAALVRLQAGCAAIDPIAPAPALVTTMFADAWSIIDQVDLVRQIIQAASGDAGPVTSAFLTEAQQVRRLRNQMDHISQLIPNIAARTGTSEALFGSVSFVRCGEAVLAAARPRDDCAGEAIVIARGTVPGYRGAAEFPFNTHDIDRPISNLRLNAAERSIPLDWMCAQLTDILEGVSESVSASIDAQMPRLMSQTGATEQQLRSPTPTIVSAVTTIHFPVGSSGSGTDTP